jgi:septation ring formation regulator EzrA
VHALQESLEELLAARPRKLEMSDSCKASKPNTKVTNDELHINLGNLKAENEVLRQELAKTKQQWRLMLDETNLLDDSANRLKELQTENQQLHIELSNTTSPKICYNNFRV